MAIFSETLDDLVETICTLLLHDWVGGTTTASGSSTTLKDTALAAYADDYFNDENSWVYIRSGDYAGHWAKISDFAVSAGVGTVTFAPAADGTIASGIEYSIHTEFARGEVVQSINLAINSVAEHAHVWVRDEDSVTLVASTYEYDLPTNLMWLCRVTMANSDGEFDDMPEIPPSEYEIVHAPTAKLRFRKTYADELFAGHYVGDAWSETDLTADRALRLEGLGAPATLTTDSSACPISPAYVTFQAAAFLHLSRTKRSPEDPDEHYVQAKLCQDRADVERGHIVPMQLPIGAKRIRE